MPINKGELLGRPAEKQSIEEAIMAVLDANPDSAYTLDEVTDALRQGGHFSSERNVVMDTARTISTAGALSTLAAMGRVAKRAADGHTYYYRP